jgi:hypothetical protein
MVSEDAPAGGVDGEGNREQGVELGALGDELETHDYPVSSSELVEAHGDFEIGLPGGSQVLSEVLGLLGESGKEFERPDDVRRAIHSLVGSEAVGRQRYSDRGGSTPDENDLASQESF